MAETNETIADIIAEMRNYSNECNDGYRTDYGVVCTDICNYADRIEAAYRVEKLRWVEANAGLAKLVDLEKIPTGNMAKMREVLETCANWGEQIDCQLGSSEETVYAFRHERCIAYNISECARAALSEPPRNCDKHGGDPKKLHDEWWEWSGDRKNCNEDGTVKMTYGEWLLEKAKGEEDGSK